MDHRDDSKISLQPINVERTAVDVESESESESDDDDLCDGLRKAKEGEMGPNTDEPAKTAFKIRRRRVTP